MTFLIQKIALNSLLIIFSLTILLHLLILIGVIPYSIAWGGRITTPDQMYIFETVSILLNGFFLFIILVKAEYLNVPLPKKGIRIVLWIMAGIFTLNTIGNLFSTNSFEKTVFTPVTLMIAVLCMISTQEGKTI